MVLKPVGGVEDDRLEVVWLVPQGGHRGSDVREVLRQRELGGVDLAEAVLCLNEDWIGRGGAEEALAYALLSVHEQTGRAVLLALGDGAEQ